MENSHRSEFAPANSQWMRAFGWLFGCHHRRLSRVMTINDETFQVCLHCGHHVPYCWNAMSRVGERQQTNA